MSPKRFVPLESDPEIFTQLIHRLGISESLSFVDILSLSDPDLLAFIPRPVLALIFIFPDTPTSIAAIAKEEEQRPAYTGSGEEEDIVWFKQTIRNACGLYAILHSALNGKARDYIKTGSTLAKLLAECTPLDPKGRAQVLESSDELEVAHSSSAQQGQSSAPPATIETPFHYIAFVKSHKSGHMYELNGSLKGPVDIGMVGKEDDDLLCEDALKVLSGFVDREMKAGGELSWGFTLMALVPSAD